MYFFQFVSQILFSVPLIVFFIVFTLCFCCLPLYCFYSVCVCLLDLVVFIIIYHFCHVLLPLQLFGLPLGTKCTI